MTNKTLVAAMNKRIKNCPLPEARQNLINSFTALLMDCKAYKGYSMDDWAEKGHAAWIAAGQPDDKKQFFGDETKITFLN